MSGSLCHCTGELRALVALAALDLDIFRPDLAFARDVIQNRRPLRLKAKTALALTLGGYSKVGDEFHDKTSDAD